MWRCCCAGEEKEAVLWLPPTPTAGRTRAFNNNRKERPILGISIQFPDYLSIGVFIYMRICYMAITIKKGTHTEQASKQIRHNIQTTFSGRIFYERVKTSICQWCVFWDDDNGEYICIFSSKWGGRNLNGSTKGMLSLC